MEIGRSLLGKEVLPVKIIRNIIIGLVIIVAVLILGRNFLIRVTMEQGMRTVTGLKLSIHKFDIGLFKPVISIQGLKVYNPREFAYPEMLSLPEIYIRYDPLKMLKGTMHFTEIRFSLEELVVIRQEGKPINLNALSALKPPQGGAPPKFHIDSLTLHIGKVIYKDYTQTPPSSKEFNVNLNEHYIHIQKPDDLVRLIVLRALAKTTIAQLTHLNLNDLKNGLSNTLLQSLQVNDNLIKGVLDSLERSMETLPFTTH